MYNLRLILIFSDNYIKVNEKGSGRNLLISKNQFLIEVKQGTLGISNKKNNLFNKHRIEKAIEENEISNGAMPKRDIDYQKAKSIVNEKFKLKMRSSTKSKTKRDRLLI